MRKATKIKTVILVAVLAIVLPTILFWDFSLNSSSVEKSVQDKTISVLKDVVGLNLTGYKVNISVHDIPFTQYEGSKVEDISCILQSNQSSGFIIVRFINGTLTSLDLTSAKSLLSYLLPADPLDASKILLERLEHYYSNPSYLKPIANALSLSTNMNSFNQTIDNIKREAIINTEFIQVNQTTNYTSTYTSIRFMYVFGDAKDSPKSIIFSFRDGSLVALGNNWERYRIGSQSINISRDQAINMAIEQGNNATNGLTLSNQPIRADLHLVTREPFVLYPLWFVDLPLASPPHASTSGQSFVHSFTELQVSIWADTGEIENSHPAS